MTIRGRVNARREAVVVLHVRGPRGDQVDVSAVVDTGFAGSMVLPRSVIASLGLAKRTTGGAKLGDGTIRRFDLFTAEIVWGGAHRAVDVAGIGDEVLIGMRLLAGHVLRAEVVPGGVVEVTPLP